MQRHRQTLALALFATALAFGFSGCKPDAAVQQGEVIGRGSKAPVPPNQGPPQPQPQPSAGTYVAGPTAGAITGTIFFKGKVPSATIDTSMDPACSMGAASQRLPVEQYVVNGGRLANVFVYVKSGPSEAMQMGPVAAPPVVLDQVHCQYVPHVIAVMAGGSVEFRNSDPTMHNIHTMPTSVGNDTIDISEGPRGQSQTRQFQHPELMIPVRCNNHPWMNAFINVSATPFFAVTDASGRFDLKGLPPGDYTLGAVHEKMGEKTMYVTVSPNGTAKAEFSFSQ